MKIFIAVFLGVLAAVMIVAVLLYLRVKRKIGETIGFDNLRLIAQNLKNGEYQTDEDAYSSVKSIAGMTSIYEPRIREDFKDFNLNLLYSNIESNLRSILNAKTNLDMNYAGDESLVLVAGNLKKEIDDMVVNQIKVSYKDIIFHKHVIKSYTKKNGTATITTASSVGYYYSSNKKEKQYKDIRKETVYTCEFVYVYDEAKFELSEKAISINCHNCGAPLKGLDGGTCEYCGTYSKPINLKAWKLASYKENKR